MPGGGYRSGTYGAREASTMSDYGNMPPAPPSGPGGNYGGYQQGGGYPQQGGGYGYPAPQRGERPPSVENAVRLMFVVAALSLISTIVAFATKNQLKDRIEKANPDVSSARIDSLLNTAFTVGLLIGLVFLVLYVLLAFQVRAGKNWARIVTWIFAGLGVIGALSSLASTETPLSRVFSLISGIIDIVIIVLLAQGASNRYFKPRPY